MNTTAPSINRPPIACRDWSHAQRLMRTAGITQRDVACEAGVPLASVYRALSLRFFARTSYSHVVRVRAAVERLLMDHRVAYSADALWREYLIPTHGDRQYG